MRDRRRRGAVPEFGRYAGAREGEDACGVGGIARRCAADRTSRRGGPDQGRTFTHLHILYLHLNLV